MEIIKRELQKWNIYWLLRSVFYFLYKPSYFKQRRNRVKFYRSIVGKQNDLLIFDIGAHKGELTDTFLRLKAKVISVEPGRENHQLMQRRFKYTRRVVIVNKAVSDKMGVERFYVTQNSAYNTLSEKWMSILADAKNNAWGLKMNYNVQYDVETTTLDALIAQYGIPHYIKIDVEGYELHVIRSLSHAVHVLSFETHLPEFMKETVDCLRRLVSINASSKFNYDFGEGLVLDRFVDINELISLLNKTQLRYMEIYCKIPQYDWLR